MRATPLGIRLFARPAVAAAPLWTPAILGARLVAWYEADPAFLFTNTGGTTAVSADGQHVRSIGDKSGNGNLLVASASDLGQAIYHTGTNTKVSLIPGTGDVRFTTASSAITVADGSGQHSLGFAGKFTATGTQYLVSLWDGSTTNMGFFQTFTGTPQMVSRWASGNVSDSAAATDTAQPHVFTGRTTFSGSTASSEAYNDGVSDGATTLAVALNATGAPISLFDTPGQGSQFNGDWYAAVVTSGTLTDPEHASLVTYLGSKCGRTL